MNKQPLKMITITNPGGFDCPQIKKRFEEAAKQKPFYGPSSLLKYWNKIFCTPHEIINRFFMEAAEQDKELHE